MSKVLHSAEARGRHMACHIWQQNFHELNNARSPTLKFA
eukprot:CAMPEP_0180527828 /NCGR_PEP_ID=MMETSP1036_2-20121128/60451_1 /TAXON_ID=632150 /ORGANISM="Azadinium spinosum, Strain 3D9" /LENGTH=38 /DNA_ID= /DNA_START= /DNA_END= /DNA_ORIENTATION=